MKKLEELLKNTKVECKRLGEVCIFRRGESITKKEVIEGDIPVIAGGMKPAYYHNESNRDGKTIAIASSGNAGFVSYWDIPIFLSDAFSVEPNDELNIKYLYYWLLENQQKIYQLQKSAGTPHVYPVDLAEFRIPIPPLFLQSEIVRILDTFTEPINGLILSLIRELELRKKQYRYYLEKLLSFEYLREYTKKINKNVSARVLTLGDIGEIKMCKRVLKSQTKQEGEIPFYKIGNFGKSPNAFISRKLFNEYKEKYSYPKKGEVLISASGTIGRTVIFNGEDAYFQDSNIVWLSNDESQVLNKYLYYFYQTVKWPQSKGSTITRLYNYNLINLHIHFPPISVQSHIVSVLDKFEQLVQNIEGGLPAEIALRKKQYEYYRAKLLNFDF